MMYDDKRDAMMGILREQRSRHDKKAKSKRVRDDGVSADIAAHVLTMSSYVTRSNTSSKPPLVALRIFIPRASASRLTISYTLKMSPPAPHTRSRVSNLLVEVVCFEKS